ncbi:MAG TPA: hypothetical protein VFY41_07035 [Nitrososphaeraceae archaeon]|nr:hypothetical protein [Nitrososphaeraceae archaeon]
MIDNNNNKNTIAANAAKYDDQRYCYEDPYSERRINLITEGLEPLYANDPVSKSLNSLAIQEEQGNYEFVNTAVEKVAEGAVGGSDVEQLVTTAAATTEGAAVALAEGGTTEGEGAPGGAAIGGDGGAAVALAEGGTTEGEGAADEDKK